MTERGPVPERSGASSDRPITRSSTETPVSGTAVKRGLSLADVAAFLWVSRHFFARSSAVTFETLKRHDDRLSSLVYKLGEKRVLAEQLARTEVVAFKPGQAFVTAVVALRSGAVGIFDELVRRLDSDPELHAPLASALAWLEYDEVLEHVEQLLASPAPAVVRLGLMATVAHRVDPGDTLDRILETDDLQLRATGLEAVGRLSAGHLRPRLRAALEDDDAACRFWGAWSAVRLGEAAGIPVLGQFAVTAGPFAEPACDMVLRALGPVRSVQAHARLRPPGNERLGVRGAGIIGDPILADWLLEAMQSPPLSRLAGAAFCLMTGLDLRRQDLDARNPPASPRRHPNPPDAQVQAGAETPGPFTVADDSVADDVDDELPWPDPVLVRLWWDRNRQAFTPGSRYLAGRPILPAALATVLHSGDQCQRAAAALELGLHEPDAPLLDVTGPAHRQI